MPTLSVWDFLHARLAPKAICMSGPPCSLHVSACQSVHKRAEGRLLGDTRNFRVRLANRIWANFVPGLWFKTTQHISTPCKTIWNQCILMRISFCSRVEAEFLRAILTRDVLIAIEQPASSWAFRAHLQEIIILANLWLGLTVFKGLSFECSFHCLNSQRLSTFT